MGDTNNVRTKLWKKVMCTFLSIIIAFGTFVTITFGNSKFQKWLGVRSMLSAYAAEFVDTDGAVAVDEKMMLADDHTINLINKDGTNTAYLFSEPISFTNENGNLKTKDITVEKANSKLKKDGYDFTNGQNDYRINFSKDKDTGIQVKYKDYSYTISPQSIIEVEGEEAVAEYLNENFEVFQYKNIYGNGTNLRYYPQLNGVKDEIVLNQNINKNSFSFELNTDNCVAVLNENGTISINDTSGKELQTFEAPYAYDSKYIEGNKDNHSIDCNYALKPSGENKYILTINVDKDWLNSDNTIYPVIIDPTTSNITSSKDAGVYSSKSSNNYGSEQTCCFGRASEYGYGRVYTQFTMPSAIKKGAAINSAYSWQRETTGRTTSTKVTAYLVNATWSETGITWSNKVGYNTSYASNTRTISSKSTDDEDNPYWYKFSIKTLVKKWADGAANYGMVFVSNEEADKNYNWRAFTARNYSSSAMRPYTVINYTNDATAPTVTSVTGNPTSWTNGNVTLTVNGAADNSGGVGLHSTPYSFSTTKGSYNWQAGKTKTFSSNCTVYVYVRDAWDNVRLVSTQTISKIDKTAPTYTSLTGNPTEWTNSDVTLSVNGAADAASGLNSTAYNFSTTAGTYSWQSGNTKTVSSNGTYYIYIRDAVGNIKQATTQKVNMIDKTVPSAPNVTANSTSWTNSNVTLTASSTDSQSGIAGYSFDGGATWQTENTKSFDTNQSVDVYAKDNAGNISSVSTYNITNIDKGAPSVTGVSGNPSVWTNEDVKLIVDGSVDTEAGLHSAPYSFDNGITWQADNFKVFSSNQTVNIKVRDALVNEKVLDTVVISKIDKKAPTLEVTTTSDAENITITAAAADSDSGVSLYSFDDGVSWQESNTFVAPKGTLNSIVVKVKDNAGNISEKTVDLVLPEFYEENNLIGLYNPAYQSDAVLQYKIGEDGEWTNYTVPFTVPLGEESIVYARVGESESVISKTVTPDTSSIGTYTESNTDFSLAYKNVSFDFTRTYDSVDKKWFFATDSNVTVINDYVINAILPDRTELTFIKTADDTYINEINGYTLSVTESGYVIQIDDINYYYGTDGKLSSISNKYDNTISIAKTASSITITDGANRVYTLAFDSNGNITAVTDPANNVITYTYDDNNNLTNVVDQAGVTLGQYSYTNGVLTKSMDKTINYGDDGRVTSFVYDSGAYLNYTYDDANKTVSTESSTETTTSETYNDALMIVSTTDEDGNTTEYTYDEYYRTVTETMEGTTVTYTYDDNGNLLSEVSDDEDAENTYYTYDVNGNVIRQQTGTAYTYYVYNDNGELTLTATLKADYKGDIPELYNADLTCFDTVSYTYDNGMLTKTVDSKENETVTYLYDSYGNAVKTTSSKVKDNETTVGVNDCTYDIMGNMHTSVSGEDTSSYIYDKAGRTLLANEKGDCTRTIYDNLGRVIQKIGPEDYDSTKDGLPTSNTYSDANVGQRYVYNETTGNLTSETNRLGVTTTYTYYDTGEKKTETFDIYQFKYNISGDITDYYVNNKLYAHYDYNTDGNPTKISYGNGQSIFYKYDDNGNLKSQHHNSLDNPAYVEYDYKPAPEQTEIDTAENLDTDENVTVETNEGYVLKSKTNYDSNLYYEYFNSGKVTVAYANDESKTVIYSYYVTSSDDDSTTTTTTGTVNGTSYSTVSAENSITHTFGNNSLSLTDNTLDDVTNSTIKYGDLTVLAYSQELQENQTIKNYDSLYQFKEEYNSNGTIHNSYIGNDFTTYEYYDNGQLKKSTNGDVICTYTYSNDIRGNILTKTVNGVTTSFEYQGDEEFVESETNKYSSPDRLKSVNSISLSYDKIGNVTAFGTKSFTWADGRNLATITDSSNNDSISYTYNRYGYRTGKAVNGVATNYIVDENGTVVAQKTGNDTLYFEYDNYGSPLGFVYNGIQYLYITNIRNDVIAITDTTGTVVAGYTYGDWGECTVDSTSTNLALANLNPLRYRGYYYDNETGYYYLQSRYYDPSICRFINSDLPEYAKLQKDDYAGTNLFAYCLNNPINSIDIDGRKVSKLNAAVSIIMFVVYYLAKKILNLNSEYKIECNKILVDSMGLYVAKISYYKYRFFKKSFVLTLGDKDSWKKAYNINNRLNKQFIANQSNYIQSEYNKGASTSLTNSGPNVLGINIASASLVLHLVHQGINASKIFYYYCLVWARNNKYCSQWILYYLINISKGNRSVNGWYIYRPSNGGTNKL